MSMKKSGALSLAIGGMADMNAIDQPNYEDMVRQAYGSIGRSGFGDAPSNIDQAGFNYWVNTLKSGASTPEAFQRNFNTAVQDYVSNKDNNVSQYVNQYLASNPIEQTRLSDTGKTEYVGPGTESMVWNIAQGAPATQTTEAPTTSEAPAVQMVRDYRGQEYDPSKVLSLAQQVANNFDTSQMSGGVFGTTGESVGFNYDDALRITGNSALTAPQQVALDMARYLIDHGITDLNQIKTTQTYNDLGVTKNPIYDESGNFVRDEYRLSFMPDAVTWSPGDGEGRAINRELTPDEIATLRVEKVKDPDTGMEYDRYVLPETSVQRLSLGDVSGDRDVAFGTTFTGPGGTVYRAFIDPSGQVRFTTTGQSSSDLEAVQPFLTLASFIPGVAPFAQAANAAIAIDQGNTLGGLASLAGLGGFSNVATGLNAANAIVNKDPFALVNAFAGTQAGRDFMNTEIADGYTNRDAFNVARTVNAINQGNLGMAVSAAADLSHSDDAQKAAAGFNLLYALQSGNPYQISNAMGTFLQNVAPTQRTRTASDDSQQAYVAAMNAGATEEEAEEIARIFSGPQYAAAGTGTVSDSGPGTIEVSGAPIFAESRNAGSVRPPPGYTLMSTSEMDSRPAGSYYDNILNAWLKPTGGFESINEMLGANRDFDAGSLPEDAGPITGQFDYEPYTGGTFFGEAIDAIDRLPGVSGPVTFDQQAVTGGREPANLDQVTVSGSPEPANLDQVVVTAPPEPENLDQVVVTAPPEQEPVDLEAAPVTEQKEEPADLGTVTVTAPPEAEIPPPEEERAPTRTTSGTSSTGSGGGGYMMMPPSSSVVSGPAIASLAAQMLEAKETQKQAIDPLARVKAAQEELERELMLQNIDPRLLAVLQQRMQDSGLSPQGQQDLTPQEDRSYYAYGSEQSIDDILGNTSERTYKDGGYVAPLMAQGGMALPLLAKSGGALDQAHRNGREDFKDGKHVAGEGDGQSDDIPAWLADGEFVFPADVVSALGNGSTKAGTDKLYEMMHNIRDRARSKGPKDLPPPALKSPLDYLKSAKRSAK